MIIGGYQPLSLCNFPGKVAAVLFTQGCNFRCPFCHNGELLPMSPPSKTGWTNERVCFELQKRRSHLDGVVVSGGEPTVQEDLILFLEKLRLMNFAIKLDTNGSRPGTLKEILQARLVDYVAMDIKAPWRKYNQLAGVSAPVQVIAESLHLVAKSGIAHEFRTTMAEPLLTAKDLAEIRAMLPAGSLHRTQPFRPENAWDPNLRKRRQ